MIKHLFLLFLICTTASAQTVEFYTGHQRTGIDILWFKPIVSKQGQQSPWLFFSRMRASVDRNNQAQWGATNAVSYNLKQGLGFVGAAVFSSNGLKPKLGIQLVKMKTQIVFFGWVVVEPISDGNAEIFGLIRYTPHLNQKLRWFLQGELFNVLPTSPSNAISLTQRVRIGIRQDRWQYGCMTDITESGKNKFYLSTNYGLFLRHEF
ncbi:MAG: hypothetical protein ACOVP7_03825 [Lacibacter sp.]